MRTITLKLYKFEELSKDAQRVAKNNVGFETYDSDLWECARAAQKLYDRLKEPIEDIYGNRLRTWIVNNIMDELTSTKYYGNRWGREPKFRFSRIFKEVDEANLTGVSFDYDFLAPLMDFVKKPDESVSNYDLARTNLESIAMDIINAEEEYFYSDEGFSDYCEGNNMEFLHSGVPFDSVVKDCVTVVF